MQGFEKKLEEWVKAGLLTQNTADNLLAFENKNKDKSSSAAILIFSILGAILTALGISLLVAENWDRIPVLMKTVLAFVPLVVAQILAAVALFKFKNSLVWRESTGAFLSLSIGASLAVVGQIYQLQPSVAGFLLLWLVCAAPVMFILQSRTSWMLFIAGATWYCAMAAFSDSEYSVWHYTWLLAGSVLFMYRFVWNKNVHHAFSVSSGWILSLSLTISLGFFSSRYEEWMMFVYLAMFQCFMLLSLKPAFSAPEKWHAGFGNIGIAGVTFIALMQSYQKALRFTSENLFDVNHKFWSSNEFWILVFFTLAYIGMVIYLLRQKEISFAMFLFPVLTMLIFVAHYALQFSQIAINAGILIVAALYIQNGIKHSSLLKLNGGLLVISALILLRFFDYYISFTARGIAFLAIGMLFFMANRMLVRKEKMKSHEEH